MNLVKIAEKGFKHVLLKVILSACKGVGYPLIPFAKYLDTKKWGVRL